MLQAVAAGHICAGRQQLCAMVTAVVSGSDASRHVFVVVFEASKGWFSERCQTHFHTTMGHGTVRIYGG